MESKFNHSAKVPQLYKKASQVLKSVQENQLSFRAAIFACKHPRTSAIQGLVMKALQHSEELDYVISKSRIIEDEPRLAKQEYLFKILISELLWGKKGIGGQAKPIATVLEYQQKLENALHKYVRKPKNKAKLEEEGPVLLYKPRYVRVNTLFTTVDEVLAELTKEGWNQVDPCDFNTLKEGDFFRDDFVDTLLVFPPRTTFYKHHLYLSGHLILQDKASCLAAMALKPRTGRGILDACAAPGMKTTFLAAVGGKDSPIYAVEKNKQRFETLKTILEKHGCDFVDVKNCDFTELEPKDFINVEYILVDPSCSGSGMVARIETTDKPTTTDPDRLANLAHYQKKVLCHAMKFPSVKRIVYSTCSINAEENEDVVNGALEIDDNHRKFRIKKALPAWKHRVSNTKYDWSEMCACCDFESDATDGFFISVLERIGSSC